MFTIKSDDKASDEETLIGVLHTLENISFYCGTYIQLYVTYTNVGKWSIQEQNLIIIYCYIGVLLVSNISTSNFIRTTMLSLVLTSAFGSQAIFRIIPLHRTSDIKIKK